MKTKIALVTAGLLFFLCTVATYGAVIQGKLLDPKGTPLPNLSVKIEAIEIKPVETVSAVDGTFKFDNLTMKNWKISINDDKWESINLEIRVLSDTETIDHNLVAWQKLQLSGDLLSSYQKAFESYSAKSYDEAIVEVDKLFQAGQSFYNIYALKGLIFFEQQKYTDAIPLLKMAVELNPYDISSNQLLANYAFDKQNYKDCLPYYEKVLYVNPTNPDLNEQIGDAYYNLKNWEKAVEYYQNAVKYFGSSSSVAQAQYGLGACYINLKKYSEALKAFEAFIIASPNDSRIPKTKMLVEKLKEAVENDKKKSENTPK